MEKRTNTATWSEKEQRWTVRVQRDGKRRAFHSSTPGRRGQREANAKADAWLDDHLVAPHTKASVLYAGWIESLKATTSKDHWRQYDGFGRNYILPQVGTRQVGSLTEIHLQAIIDAAYENGLTNKKTLSNLRGCLSAFLKYARRAKATSLRLEGLTIPKGAVSGNKQVLRPRDLAALLDNDFTLYRGREVKELYANAYRFEVLTGLRPGEVIGLRKTDLLNGVLYVRGSINRYGERTTGKNENAVRSFVLHPLAMQVLARQDALLKEFGIVSPVLFPNELGLPIAQATYYKRWVAYRDHLGLAKVSPYELRHTFISVCKRLPKGLLEPVVGHSEDMDTFGVYGHPMGEDPTETAALIGDAFRALLAQDR